MDDRSKSPVIEGPVVGTPEWLEARKSGIGASELPSLFGIGFKSRLRLWAEKTGKLVPPDLDDNEAVHWGNTLESIVAEEYERRTGRLLRKGTGLMVSGAHPWAMATPDYWWGDKPVQIKTTSAYRLKDWVDGPPLAVRIQVHGEMLVTGADMASVGVLVGGQRFMWADVERDETLMGEIVSRASEFWAKVQADEWPDLEGMEDETEVIAQVYPLATGETIAMPPMATAWAEALDELDVKAKLLKEHQELLKNEVRLALGAAEIGRLPDGSGWSLRLVKRKGYAVEPSESRQLRRLKA